MPSNRMWSNKAQQWLLPWCLRRWLLQCGRPGFNPWIGKIPWRRKWKPTPVFLPENSHEWRSLVGYSPWGHQDSDSTERLHFTSLLSAVLMLLCYIRTLWVQCAGIFLINSFPTSDFGFTHLFNFCSSFFSLYSQAYLSPVIISKPLQQLSLDHMLSL